MAFWQICFDKGSNHILVLHEIKNLRAKVMTVSTDWAILNSKSSFVPKYWLNWQILHGGYF